MNARTPDLVLSSAPFSRETASTPRIMLEVLAAALVLGCWWVALPEGLPRGF